MEDSSDEGGGGPLLKNRYRLGRVLGRGGMCIVYQAWDTRLQRNVAVKRLEPPLSEDPRTRARFDREGRALAQLSHPNLVTLIDRGSSEDEDYLVFEYVEGRSLKELIREGLLGIGEFGRIAGQVAEGLATAHAAGIIHRDVKPQNILIDRNGHAKVTDFGIATGPDWTRVTRAGSVIGSARYMSPEQIRSKPVDARSDIYSLGVVMYEMLTGNPPFDGTNMPEIARMHLSATPPPISDVRTNLPEGLEKVVMRCLEKLPEDRFSSMDELLGALVGLGLYAPQRVTEVAPAPRRSSRRGGGQERPARLSAGVAAGETGGTRDDDTGETDWVRERAREMARKRRAARRWKWIGALAAIAAVAVALALVFTLTGGGAPAVLGLKVDQAKVLAEQAGMTVEVTDEVLSLDREADVVLEQDPEPEKKGRDDVLRLTVTREAIPVEVASLDDADSEGDNVENPDKLPNLIDGKESTVWTTELYRSAAFGDLKTGVGIDFVLEEEATVVEIVSAVEGWKGQLLRFTSSGGMAQVERLDGEYTQIITLQSGITKGRVWFTQLTKLTENRWGVELSEIRFYR
ncbi:MAG: serine/threonine protein kinase [Thermoleophilia bacterium]|nr:serine/threonine protein kinase [Thermoleophilia bacterium]